MADKVLTVSQINRYIKRVFDNDYVMKNILIQGEISNCKIHSSGHIYLTLKDNNSTLACVLFKSHRDKVLCEIRNGIKVIAGGSITVYERNGQYQLYINSLIEDGIGILYQKYELLKKKLMEEGYFSQELKKKIPLYPRKVGIVTSDTGAAIRDIVQVSYRRNPYIQLVLYPSLVQGDYAKYNIVKGIKYLDQLEDIDVIIIGRGGGSLEDLWAFNEEIVAETIYKANTPIISAVGHETDFTISDFVADVRASTPSAAAEIAIPSINEIFEKLDKITYRLNHIINNRIENIKNNLYIYNMRIEAFNPKKKIGDNILYLIELEERLNKSLKDKLLEAKNAVKLNEMKLLRFSPYEKLKSGYVYVKDKEHKPIKSISAIQENDDLTIQFYEGQADVRVLKLKKGKGFNEQGD